MVYYNFDLLEIIIVILEQIHWIETDRGKNDTIVTFQKFECL